MGFTTDGGAPADKKGWGSGAEWGWVSGMHARRAVTSIAFFPAVSGMCLDSYAPGTLDLGTYGVYAGGVCSVKDGMVFKEKDTVEH